jgi:hypothetical protein
MELFAANIFEYWQNELLKCESPPKPTDIFDKFAYEKNIHHLLTSGNDWPTKSIHDKLDMKNESLNFNKCESEGSLISIQDNDVIKRAFSYVSKIESKQKQRQTAILSTVKAEAKVRSPNPPKGEKSSFSKNTNNPRKESNHSILAPKETQDRLKILSTPKSRERKPSLTSIKDRKKDVHVKTNINQKAIKSTTPTLKSTNQNTTTKNIISIIPTCVFNANTLNTNLEITMEKFNFSLPKKRDISPIRSTATGITDNSRTLKHASNRQNVLNIEKVESSRNKTLENDS